jgi:hypothetical protein
MMAKRPDDGSGHFAVDNNVAAAMVSIFTSACCTSRLARGNTQEQTRRQTSSNYPCTNDELGN